VHKLFIAGVYEPQLLGVADGKTDGRWNRMAAGTGVTGRCEDDSATDPKQHYKFRCWNPVRFHERLKSTSNQLSTELRTQPPGGGKSLQRYQAKFLGDGLKTIAGGN